MNISLQFYIPIPLCYNIFHCDHSSSLFLTGALLCRGQVIEFLKLFVKEMLCMHL